MDNPTDLDTLHSLADETQAAIEAALGVEPGAGVDVTCYLEPDSTLAVTFLLIGEVARCTSMRTFTWNARDGWRACRAEHDDYTAVPMEIPNDTWQPALVAAEACSHVERWRTRMSWTVDEAGGVSRDQL